MKPTLLIILDGWGVRKKDEYNAIHVAHTPNYDRFIDDFPHSTILTHGTAVGLTEGIMGNSEVGHMNIGAGRIVYQLLTLITKAIEDKSFFENEVLVKAIRTCKEKGSALHLMGLMSDAGVHSDMAHLEALLQLASNFGLEKVFVHAFMDGRDTSPKSGAGYLRRLENTMRAIGIGHVATISGRYYSMDRDRRWERIHLAYDAIVAGRGETSSRGPASAVEEWYATKNPKPGFGDEFVPPTVLMDPETKQTIGRIQDNDVVIHFNFRPDRARELTRVLTDQNFDHFKREPFPKLANFTTMAPYSEELDLPYAYHKQALTRILPEILSERGIKQFRIAETEKYAHVTYFFNGGEEKVYPGEDRKLIPSNREIPTYDLAPEMRAREVTAEVLNALKGDKYGFYVINFANPDMVGHTGKIEAAVKAVETLDECIGKIVNQALEKDDIIVITSDHGNCEEMIDAEGNPHTQHSLNPAPFIIIGNNIDKNYKLKSGRLCDVAPTLLQLMGIEKPAEMTGESLIQ